MLRRALAGLGLLMTVLGAAESLNATTFANRPLVDVIREAAAIARGRAGESYSDWAKTGGRTLYTYTHFSVTEVLKGDLKEGRVLLRQPGGSKDGVSLHVPGAAAFAAGEEAVVLLGPKNTEDDSFDVSGFTTGKYVLVEEGGKAFLQSSLGGAELYDPARGENALSYNSRIPLELFRRIARGGASEEKSMQFSESRAPAPPVHAHAPAPAPAHGASVPPSSAAGGDATGVAHGAPVASAGVGIWIPLSFVAAVAAGGFLLWRLLRGRRGA